MDSVLVGKAQEPSQAVRRAAKAKRVRTIFTPEQLERLEAEFERQQYMVGPERLYLASSLHLTEAQVRIMAVLCSSLKCLAIKQLALHCLRYSNRMFVMIDEVILTTVNEGLPCQLIVNLTVTLFELTVSCITH